MSKYMQNKLQELTDKLYNEGLSKGKQEAELLRANAKKEAEKIIMEDMRDRRERHDFGPRKPQRPQRR